MDLEMPEMHGTEAIRAIRNELPLARLDGGADPAAGDASHRQRPVGSPGSSRA